MLDVNTKKSPVAEPKKERKKQKRIKKEKKKKERKMKDTEIENIVAMNFK